MKNMNTGWFCKTINNRQYVRILRTNHLHFHTLTRSQPLNYQKRSYKNKTLTLAPVTTEPNKDRSVFE